jgi:transcription elongation factor GreB
MSKAFTSEESEDPVAIVRAPPAPGELRPITPAGHAALVAALRTTESERAAAKSAAEAGALDAGPRLQAAGQRAALLEATLATVRVVAPSADLSRSAFGHEVEVEDEDGVCSRYTLVGPDEAEPRGGRISAASPLGRALLGRAPGDDLEVQLPRGEVCLTVRAVRLPSRS